MDNQEAGPCCSQTSGEKKSYHDDILKSKLFTRLSRIEGQIRGIKGLIERETYCDDILNQISAIQSALNGVGKVLLENHMKSCVIDRVKAGDHQVLDEIIVTAQKLFR